jgi:hypothetical protein
MPDGAIGEPRLLAHPADERLRHTRLTQRCSSWRLPPASAHFGRVTDSGGKTDMHCASIRYGGDADWLTGVVVIATQERMFCARALSRSLAKACGRAVTVPTVSLAAPSGGSSCDLLPAKYHPGESGCSGILARSGTTTSRPSGAGRGLGACAAACPAQSGYRRLKTGTSPSGRRTSIARGRPGWRCTHPLASNSVSW